MDWTKLVFSMFTNRGKEGHTWPRSVISSHKNHLCTRKLSYQHNEKPDILRLNSVGETSPEEEFLADSSGFVKKGILGDFPTEASRVTNMPCHNNNHHRSPPAHPGRSFQNSMFFNKRNPAENGYNFNMAQRHYRFPACGMGYQPVSPRQQYSNGWAYSCWPQNTQGPLFGNPFVGSGHPVGFAAYHQGMPFIATQNSGYSGSPRRHLHRKATQNMQSQGKGEGKCAEKPDPQKNDKKAPGIPEVDKVPTVLTATCVNSVADTLKELHIASEDCDRKNEGTEYLKSKDPCSMKMYVTVKDVTHEKPESANELDCSKDTKKENIPSPQKRVCDNCKKCLRKGDCVGVGYCLLSPSSGHGKVTLILGSKDNLDKLSNSNGKNGYHEKAHMTATNDSAKLSDERVPSQMVNDQLHHDHRGGDTNSSHSTLGSKPKFEDPATPTNPSLLAKVLLQRNMSSKRKQTRPSCKKRHKDKTPISLKETDEKSAQNKKRKVNHRDHEVPSTADSKSKTRNTIAYILGFSPPQSTKSAQIHCKVSVQPDKFSFTISSGDDTDFSDDDDSEVALSEDDADIWNSFNKCDDPYNPLNFLTATCSSVPKVIPKSSSAPSLLSPEVLQDDDIWQKDPPAFSPPKPEALIRTAKKVHFPIDDHMVQVHAADDWERKGPWEQMALDSQRFHDRIEKTDQAIGYIFNVQHRQNVLKRLGGY